MTTLTKKLESIFLSEGFLLSAHSFASVWAYASRMRSAFIGTARSRDHATKSCQDLKLAIRWPFIGNRTSLAIFRELLAMYRELPFPGIVWPFSGKTA